jgi:hypothetical protein
LSDVAELRVQAAQRTLALYAVIVVVSLGAILALVGYSLRLGPLVGPGVEESFGFALALMFLFGALLFHVADRTYRVWPLGRRIRPAVPAPVATADYALFLRVLIVVVALAAMAYILGSLIAS